MGRTACVWIPRFELQARLVADPTLQGHPVLIADAGSLRALVIDASPEALQAGVQPQMPMSAARAVCPAAVIIPPDPDFVAYLSKQILTALYRFAPIVGRDGSEAFFLDLEGLHQIYPDESLLTDKLRLTIEAFELTPVVALADSPISAWVVARAQGRCANQSSINVVPPGQDRAFLAKLPLSSIPMPMQLIRLCRVLGLQSLGDLQRLPAGALWRRFHRAGAEVQARAHARSHDLFRVEIPETIEQAELQLDHPTADLEPLLFLHKSVLDRLLVQVAATRRSIATLDLTLILTDSDRTRVCHSFRPARPTLDSRSLLDLIALWLSSGPVTELVDEIVMRATEVGQASARQLRLFEKQEDLAEDALQIALSRLVAAFGPQTVVKPVLCDRHLPEQRIAWQPALPTPSPPPHRDAFVPSLEAHPPVLLLVDPPMPIELRGEHLRSTKEPRWQRIVSSEGPWTVEGEWWAKGFRREYRILTTEQHEVLWVFRDRRGYHLHAYLD